MDTQNSHKKSPRSSTNHESDSETLSLPDEFSQRHVDRSFDQVARVHAAKEGAQRAMEEFGDPSEYDVYELGNWEWVLNREAQVDFAGLTPPRTIPFAPKTIMPIRDQKEDKKGLDEA